MKILLVNDYINIIGGTEVYVYNLKRALEKEGHEVRVFGSNKSKEEYIKTQSTKSFMRYLNKIFNIRLYYSFRKLLHEFQPEVIHLHNIYNELSPGILLGLNHPNIIMTVHDTLLVNPVSILSERTGKNCKTMTCRGCDNCIGWKGAMYETFRHWLHNPLLKKIRIFITPSEFMGKFMIDAGYKNVKAIPNGIELYSYFPVKNFKNILYVGRLTKEKGIETLLKSFKEVIKIHPTAELTLVGAGPDKTYFENLTKKLDIARNVIFTGVKNKKETEKYYQNSTLIVVPSVLPDNFPTVCLEAMSIGRPLIGSNIGGIPEMIKDKITGFLFSPSNSDELANKINELLNDKQKILTMSENAWHFSFKYNIKIHLEKIMSIYNIKTNSHL